MNNRGILTKYKSYLPLTSSTPFFTLGEGNTPLARSANLEKELEVGELYFKLEGCNPTGSFKDRGMVMAVAKALEANSATIMCASTGNTSASAAAYGANRQLKTIVFVPHGKIARSKVAQAAIYGAKIVFIKGNFDQALAMVRQLTQKYPITLVNSINPFRLEGQKTAAFEIVDDLGEAPDYLFIPVGNAGNITAYWMGFKQYHEMGKARLRPKMMGFEAEGAAPIVLGKIIEEPQSVASAIRIGNPANWKGAVCARDESGGVIDYISDSEIVEAYSLLARKEGIFGEPASAASLAGLVKMKRKGFDFRKNRIVCIITGSGLKDPETALDLVGDFPVIPPELSRIEEALNLI